MDEHDLSCPCGIEQDYAAHCAPVHRNGAGLGATAESLMRARYSGYVLQRRDFLLSSWHPDTCPDQLSFDPDTRWLGLQIVATEAGGGLDATGVVEFKARFQRGDEFLELHERSSFVRVDGDWLYVDGDAPAGD